MLILRLVHTRAIALSLQDTGGRPQQAEVINVDDDDAQYEDDFKRAIELSKQQSGPTPAFNPPQAQPQPPATTASRPAAGFLSERAQLERERLERLKRTRPDIHRDSTAIVVDSDSENDDDDDVAAEERARSAKRQHISSSSRAGARRANSSSSSTSRNVPSASTSAAAAARARPAAASSSSGQGSTQTRAVFWNGELRQTANMHVDQEKDTRPVFRLSEIISPVRIVPDVRLRTSERAG